MVHFGDLLNEFIHVGIEQTWVFVAKDVEVDTVLATGNEGTSVLQAKKRLQRVRRYLSLSFLSLDLLVQVFPNLCQHKSSRRNGLEVSSRHLRRTLPQSRFPFLKDSPIKPLDLPEVLAKAFLGQPKRYVSRVRRVDVTRHVHRVRYQRA